MSIDVIVVIVVIVDVAVAIVVFSDCYSVSVIVVLVLFVILVVVVDNKSFRVLLRFTIIYAMTKAFQTRRSSAAAGSASSAA